MQDGEQAPEDANVQTPISLVPPRPNLGPEPYLELNRGSEAWSIVLFAGLCVLAASLVLAFSRRWSKRRSNQGETTTDLVELSPKRLMELWSGEVRDALIKRFGPKYAGTTTEELAEDSAIVGALGRTEADLLLELLGLADRVKFSTHDDSWNSESFEHWRRWVEDLPGKLEPPRPVHGRSAPAAGATSSTSGR